MKRWDPAITYLGSGEYAPDMEESDDGEYVRYVGHSGAMHAEVRQTQRRMIAALYWRAGEVLAWIRPGDSHDQRRYWRRQASALQGAAQAMEAACAR